ncbi:DNA protecting protein DprA [Aeromonas salmonicida]|uniref:DNA-processing protein DprA n=1 Tax=Aeromonas salmonicida TaxID=645 RepID=UPI00102846E3|nr:DNA-processing protein DprA [Aeromonas salmonicida]VFB10068.1 DNA protecting protein DprA [Aeromonas salmonicida]
MHDYVSQETLMLLMLSNIKGIGEKKLLSLRSITNLKEYSFHDILENILREKKENISLLKDKALCYAEDQVAEAKQRGHKIISVFDKEYPSQLTLSNDSPPVLFVAGNIDILNEKAVAVIGTREPTDHGKIICERLTKWLVENDWVIVSGLAKGIDSISHEACLKFHGKTVAVLAQGLEKIYPQENRILADNIIKSGGALLSEYPYKSFTGKSNFVKRDATQAGLSSSVFLVQTGVNGGSLHASRAILKYGRPLVVVGQSKTDENKRPDNVEGNLLLLNGNYKDTVNMLGLKFDENLIIKMKDKDDFTFVNEKIKKHSFFNTQKTQDSFKLL